MHSPLRYPGGKSDFFLVAKEIFERGGFVGRRVIEPYAGSAAVSLGLLDFGLTPSVTLMERDPLLYSFWHCVFERTSDLVVAFQDLPVTLETWKKLQPLLRVKNPAEANVLDLAVAGLFFNRANFSGILNAGPIGGQGQASEYKIDCRTNKDEIISRILALAMLSGKVQVEFGDALGLIKANEKSKDAFLYLDPPYFLKGELLYRHFYGMRDHKALSQALKRVNCPWLLSYDDHYMIEFLYEDRQISRLAFQYSARSAKRHQELLISNFKLPLGDLTERAPVRRSRSLTPTQKNVKSIAEEQREAVCI